MGKTEKKLERKSHNLKWPKYQKPKDENMVWTKQKWVGGSEKVQNYDDIVHGSSLGQQLQAVEQ